jgi:coproporphyrinogen III oxidase-like Fe-S oxidoreductase
MQCFRGFFPDVNMPPDLNFLRFLTISLPTGIEDPFLAPLFRPLTSKKLQSHFVDHTGKKDLFSIPKKMNLYIHVPFCGTICSFCHCHHWEVKDQHTLRTYVDFILGQISEFSGPFDKTEFGSFTVLGGTASLLSAAEIRTVYEAVCDKFHFHPQARFNFEGHPSSLSVDKLDILKGYGVKKIHLGVQSLDEGVLKKINRFQTREGVERCIKNIKERGFTCVNADMVPGLPGQTTAGFLEDIRALAGWGVDLFNINPFSDITSMNCSKDVSESLQAVLSRRNEMILQTKTALEDLGYANKGQQGYCKGAKGQSLKLETDSFPGGVLGLGMLAKSNLPGELVFMNLPKGRDSSDVRYVGYPIDKHYSMAQYVSLHLLYGLETKEFHRVFGEEFDAVFGKEIKDLAAQGIISRNDRTYCFSGARNLKDLFEYCAYTKVLLGENLIQELRMHYNAEYDPNRKYGSKEDLLKVFQDFEFAREYYQLGKKTLWL